MALSLGRRIVQFRRPLMVAGQLALIGLADYLAFWLRFDGSIPRNEFQSFLRGLPWLLLIRALLLQRFRLFEGLWRYTGLWDLRNLIAAVTLGSGAYFVLVSWLLPIRGYPRSTYVIEAVLSVFLLGGMRLVARTYREIPSGADARRVLIVGAGDAGAMIAREMKSKPYYRGVPVGFVDDDPAKRGRYIHGVRVYGGRDALPKIVEQTRPAEVLLAMPSVPAATLREVVVSLEPYDLPLKTVPSLTDLLDGTVSLGAIRPLSAEDLLERPAIGFDNAAVAEFIRGRRVLVTGAGGSIGSELCRQIATFGPASLIMLDRYENGLFLVEQDVLSLAADFAFVSLIGDITDAQRLEEIFGAHHPEIVFHAAAHKHVPLMEANPCEAVKNNILGTRILAQAAQQHQVRHFILISTDKAVNPSSVMGATKRVAERLIQCYGAAHTTVFAAVRFGNVLGSSGSVIPLFRQQIKSGGPVTVTHSEMRRFFMLIPEAVQLVLHAATMASGGEIFVLEMGKPIKVIDMARNLIRLSGSRPDVDVHIRLTGLRPGEKLEEELVAADEELEPSESQKIMRVRARDAEDPQRLQLLVEGVERAALRGDVDATMSGLRAIVPTFGPVLPPGEPRSPTTHIPLEPGNGSPAYSDSVAPPT